MEYTRRLIKENQRLHIPHVSIGFGGDRLVLEWIRASCDGWFGSHVHIGWLCDFRNSIVLLALANPFSLGFGRNTVDGGNRCSIAWNEWFGRWRAIRLSWLNGAFWRHKDEIIASLSQHIFVCFDSETWQIAHIICGCNAGLRTTRLFLWNHAIIEKNINESIVIDVQK